MGERRGNGGLRALLADPAIIVLPWPAAYACLMAVASPTPARELYIGASMLWLGALACSVADRRVLAGVTSWLACSVVPWFGLFTASPSTSALDELMWLVIGPLLAGMLLKRRLLIPVLGVHLALLAAALAVNPAINGPIAFTTFGFVVVVCAVVLSFSLTYGDIVRRLRAERQAARSHAAEAAAVRARLERVLDGMGDLVVLTDPAGRITRINAALAGELDDAEALIGRSVVELVAGEGVLKVSDLLGLARAGLGVRLSLAGGERPVSLRADLIPTDADREGGWVFVARDMTELMSRMHAEARAREARAQADELAAAHQALRDTQQELVEAGRYLAVSQLAASVSHEINNALTPALCSLDFLEQDLHGNPDLEVVRQGIESCQAFTGVLAAYGTHAESEARRIPVAELVRSTLRLARLDLTRRAANVELELDENLAVEGDPSRLSRMLHELLLNAAHAVDARADGRIRVVVRQSGEQVLVEIHDNGVGISDEDLEHIFEPFFSRISGRAGLGLAVGQSIAMAHGGSIDVACCPEEGTAFTVRLPVSPPPAPPRITSA